MKKLLKRSLAILLAVLLVVQQPVGRSSAASPDAPIEGRGARMLL